MTTADLSRTPADQNDLSHKMTTMALGIVVERIRSLPKEDRDDLFELVKDLRKANDDEEMNSIFVAMQEILDQRPMTVVATNPQHPDSSHTSPAFAKWANFIGKRIKDAREASGMTQEELSAASGLPQSHISRLERCKHSPSHVTIEKIAAALGIKASDLDPSA